MSEPTPHPANPPRQLADVPVFNCHVYLSLPDERGTIRARAATLADLEAEGRNEREALRNIVARFKETLAEYMARQESIPWLAAPHPLAPGEVQRFVPVHF